MGRILGGSFAAAVVAFFFGFLFWGVLPDGLVRSFDPLPGGGVGASVLSFGIEHSGWYYYPLPPEHEGETPSMEQLEKERSDLAERAKNGPIVMIGFRKEGASMEDPKVMALGFAHFFVMCLLLATLAAVASPKLGFLGRAGVVFIASVYGAIGHDLGPMIWWHMPGSYPTTNAAYHIMSGLLVAIVLGAIVRPQPSHAPAKGAA